MSALRADVKVFIDTESDDCESVCMYDLEDLHILHQRKTTPRKPIDRKKDGVRVLDRLELKTGGRQKIMHVGAGIIGWYKFRRGIGVGAAGARSAYPDNITIWRRI
jgi:hypothetical protein